MVKENDYFGFEVSLDALKGAAFFNQTAERIYLGDKGYKNKNEEMTDMEKELYESFDSNMGKYLFLKGLEKHNDNTLEEVEEKRRYLTKVAMFDSKDKDKVLNRIKLLDKLMTMNNDCEYITLYNKERHDAIFFKPTHNDLKKIYKSKAEKQYKITR